MHDDARIAHLRASSCTHGRSRHRDLTLLGSRPLPTVPSSTIKAVVAAMHQAQEGGSRIAVFTDRHRRRTVVGPIRPAVNAGYRFREGVHVMTGSMSVGSRATRSSNDRLQQLIRESGASSKALAWRVNQLAHEQGQKTCYTHTSVANWTRRGTLPTPAVRPLIARALSERLGRSISLDEIGMPPDDLDDEAMGLDFPRDPSEAICAATRFWSTVDRRHLLTAGLLIAGYATPVRRWLTVPADPDAGQSTTIARTAQVGEGDVNELLAAAEDARWWDSRYGGGNWRHSALTACLTERAMPLLQGNYTGTVGRRLFAATAQLSRLAGWTAFDAGDQALAQRHYIQALRLARAAGDVPLGGYTLVCMALQASLRGFHDDAIDMAQGAYERAKQTATPRALAFFRLIEARTHARAGDARSAGVSLAASETLLDRAANATGDDPDWIDFLSPQRLAADAIEIHRDLELPVQAFAWNEQAGEPTNTFARSHGMRLTILAGTHLQGSTPDLDAALAYGNQAINILARVASARAIDYARDLTRRLEPWTTTTNVAALTERVETELAA